MRRLFKLSKETARELRMGGTVTLHNVKLATLDGVSDVVNIYYRRPRFDADAYNSTPYIEKVGPLFIDQSAHELARIKDGVKPKYEHSAGCAINVEIRDGELWGDYVLDGSLGAGALFEEGMIFHIMSMLMVDGFMPMSAKGVESHTGTLPIFDPEGSCAVREINGEGIFAIDAIVNEEILDKLTKAGHEIYTV